MSAIGGAYEAVKRDGWKAAHCPNCRRASMQGAEQPNGIRCDASYLIEKRDSVGKLHYRATCEVSAFVNTCERRHLYECRRCGHAIIID